MAIDNVQLWFAKDERDNITIIDEVDKENDSKYKCPICGSSVIPRQGDINSWCFAHLDKSKCTSETQVHWWIKNKLIEKGTNFTIKSDVEKEYICEEIIVEKTYDVNGKNYTPDLTVITNTGETIYFEMEYSNKKKADDYMNVWIDLNNIVVEVNTKDLIKLAGNKLPTFKALFFNGHCREVKKGNSYYNTIGIHSEKILKDGCTEETRMRIKKLNWLWNDILSYHDNKKDISDIAVLIENIDIIEDRRIVVDILRKPKCSDILKRYVEYKTSDNKKQINLYIEMFKNIGAELKYGLEVPSKIYERIYNVLYIDCVELDDKYLYINSNSVPNADDYTKLINKIQKVYKNRIKYNRIKNITEDINKKYRYEEVCKDIVTIKSPYIKVNEYLGETYKLDTLPCVKIELLNYEYHKYIELLEEYTLNSKTDEEILDYICQEIENKDIRVPYDLDFVAELDKVTRDINNQFNIEEKNFKWCVHSNLIINEYNLELGLYCHNKYEIGCNIKLVENKLFLNNILIKENISTNENILEVKNIIIENFEDAIKSKKPILNDVGISLNSLMNKYNISNHVYLKYEFLSPTKLKMILNSYEDTYRLDIENNCLYKHGIQICSFYNKSLEEITQIIDYLLKPCFYIETIEICKDEIKNLLYDLNYRFLKVNGNWRVGKYEKNNNTIVALTNKDNIIENEFIIKTKNIDFIQLKNNILNQFSDYIRSTKYKMQ